MDGYRLKLATVGSVEANIPGFSIGRHIQSVGDELQYRTDAVDQHDMR